MPIDLLIQSKRFPEPDHTLITVCASWPDYRNFWHPGIRDLGLSNLMDLLEINQVNLDMLNKRSVVEELQLLRDWITRQPAFSDGSCQGDLDRLVTRISTATELITIYVDEACEFAAIL